MPANYTQNYQLNQWSADDQVQRVDFNADNAKIDAAIKAVDQRADALSASKADQTALAAEAQTRASADNTLSGKISALEVRKNAQLLKDITMTEASASFTLDLRDINWADWREVIVVARPSLTGADTVSVTPQGGSNARVVTTSKSTLTAVMFPMYAADMPFTGLILGSSPCYFASDGGNFNSAILEFTTSSTLNAGSRFMVYGIR